MRKAFLLALALSLRVEGQDLPKPAAELSPLEFLVGDWVCSETYAAGPAGPGGKGAARGKAWWVLGGHGLSLLYAGNTPLGMLEGRGILGWDADRHAFRLDWFDNRGLATRYAGAFDPDGRLVLEASYVRAGESVRARLTLTKRDDGSLLLSAEFARGEASLAKLVESVATRATVN